MKNIVTCGNCGTESPSHALTCSHCKAFLRSRVVNIDLWHVTYTLLIESPIKAFQEIVYAEHKNFSIILTFVLAFKFFTNTLFVASGTERNLYAGSFLSTNFLISIIAVFGYLIIFSLLFTYVLKFLGIKTRFKDNYSVYLFSFIPQLFALVILVPVQFALFGKFWFLFNPSPYLIKPNAAYILTIIEGLMILWSIGLSIAGIYVQSRNKTFSVIAGLIFSAGFLALVVYAPLYPW